MSDNVVPDLPDIRTPKTENEVMEINSPNGGTAPVAEIIIGEHSESLMEVPSGLIVVKDDATVQETAPNSEEIAAGEAVSDENKTEKTAPVQPSSAEQPKLAEEMEAIVTGAAIEAMPVADHDRRIRSRSSRYSEKDFVCPKPTVPPKKRSKKN